MRDGTETMARILKKSRVGQKAAVLRWLNHNVPTRKALYLEDVLRLERCLQDAINVSVRESRVTTAAKGILKKDEDKYNFIKILQAHGMQDMLEIHTILRTKECRRLMKEFTATDAIPMICDKLLISLQSMLTNFTTVARALDLSRPYEPPGDGTCRCTALMPN
jgi:glutaredoxin-related protein